MSTSEGEHRKIIIKSVTEIRDSAQVQSEEGGEKDQSVSATEQKAVHREKKKKNS